MWQKIPLSFTSELLNEIFSNSGCYKLGNAVGWDEDPQSQCAIPVHDPCEQLPAPLCGGCSLEWGKGPSPLLCPFLITMWREGGCGSAEIPPSLFLGSCFDYNGHYPWWVWIHAGVWRSGVGSICLQPAGLLPSGSPHHHFLACGCCNYCSELWVTVNVIVAVGCKIVLILFLQRWEVKL